MVSIIFTYQYNNLKADDFYTGPFSIRITNSSN